MWSGRPRPRLLNQSRLFAASNCTAQRKVARKDARKLTTRLPIDALCYFALTPGSNSAAL